MSKNMKIDWDKVWKAYDAWEEKITMYVYLPMHIRRNKIQSLVEAQLKRKRKKRK